MNRRDLELVARTIRAIEYGRNEPAIRRNVALCFATTLAVPAEGRDKFLKACGVINEPS